MLTDGEQANPAASLYRTLGFVQTGEHEPLESDPSLTTLAMARDL
jgi:hypothetical protein